MKQALRQVVSMLPDSALVGVVTFGAHVNVHELGHEACPKQYSFRGDRAPQPDQTSALPAPPPGVHSCEPIRQHCRLTAWHVWGAVAA